MIIGPTCSGKSECGRFLRSRGHLWIEASRKLVSHIPLDAPLQVRRVKVAEFFARRGRDYVARRVLAELDKKEHMHQYQQPAVVTGFRFVEEVELLRTARRSTVVALQSSDEMRFARLFQRGREDAAGSFDEFLEGSEWEFSLGLGEIVADADLCLSNSGSIEHLHSQLSDALSSHNDA